MIRDSSIYPRGTLPSSEPAECCHPPAMFSTALYCRDSFSSPSPRPCRAGRGDQHISGGSSSSRHNSLATGISQL